MNYVSTRDKNNRVSSAEAIAHGISKEGGLFVPESFPKFSGEDFENLKKIWNNKKCVFVEGKQTRLGVGNDLFQNTKSIKRILAPAENAFEAYDKILEECLKQGKENLFLLALGPTATVLAYDLCRQGFQAIDVGHVDLEYEWFLRGEGHRTYVEGKYNNELNGGEHPADVKDPWYEAQIVADISESRVYN